MTDFFNFIFNFVHQVIGFGTNARFANYGLFLYVIATICIFIICLIVRFISKMKGFALFGG